MNKEEVKDLITDMWKDELSKSGKWALEEYIKDLQSQLDIANKKLKEVEEYFNKDVKEELKYLYQKNDDFHKGKDYGDKGYGASIQSVQAIRDSVLSIIGDE